MSTSLQSKRTEEKTAAHYEIEVAKVAQNAQREANANALSAAIDPFTRVVDCSTCGG